MRLERSNQTREVKMRLGEFIRQTLVEVAFGVHEAKADAKDLVAIVPGSLNNERMTIETVIEFDIAVTVRESTTSTKHEGGTRGSIEVLGVGLSADSGKRKEASTDTANETVSRIAFKVPVHLNANFRGDPTSDAESAFVRELAAKRRDS